MIPKLRHWLRGHKIASAHQPAQRPQLTIERMEDRQLLSATSLAGHALAMVPSTAPTQTTLAAEMHHLGYLSVRLENAEATLVSDYNSPTRGLDQIVADEHRVLSIEGRLTQVEQDVITDTGSGHRPGIARGWHDEEIVSARLDKATVQLTADWAVDNHHSPAIAQDVERVFQTETNLSAVEIDLGASLQNLHQS